MPRPEKTTSKRLRVEPQYQLRDYPSPVVERAWQRLAGDHHWITLDRFAAILSHNTRNDALSRDLVKAAVCSKSFCGPSGRRLVLFLPSPSPHSPRGEAWRITAAEYRDSMKRFERIELLDWYVRSVWVPIRQVKDWCSKKGYSLKLPIPEASQAEAPNARNATVPKNSQNKSGAKAKYDWDAIKDIVFRLMNTRGDFCDARGWYQAKLIDLVFDELGQHWDHLPDVSVLKRRLPRWIDEWQLVQN
jgi:hypothetical protein